MGALKKLKIQGGSGGKRGHSNMAHWEYTHEIKDAARIQRRIESKAVVREGMKEYQKNPPVLKAERKPGE